MSSHAKKKWWRGFSAIDLLISLFEWLLPDLCFRGNGVDRNVKLQKLVILNQFNRSYMSSLFEELFFPSIPPVALNYILESKHEISHSIRPYSLGIVKGTSILSFRSFVQDLIHATNPIRLHSIYFPHLSWASNNLVRYTPVIWWNILATTNELGVIIDLIEYEM